MASGAKPPPGGEAGWQNSREVAFGRCTDYSCQWPVVHCKDRTPAQRGSFTDYPSGSSAGHSPAALCHVDIPHVAPQARVTEYRSQTSNVGQLRQIRIRPKSGGWHSNAQIRLSFLVGKLDGSADSQCFLKQWYPQNFSDYLTANDKYFTGGCHREVVQFLGTSTYADPLCPTEPCDEPYGSGFAPLMKVDLGEFAPPPPVVQQYQNGTLVEPAEV